MRAIQVLGGDGSYSALEESDVRERLKDGRLSPDTFYWTEGMAEWRPLQELAAFPPPPPAPTYAFAAALEPWAIILQVLLVLFLLVAALNLYGAVGQMAFAYSPAVDMKAATSHDQMMRIFAQFSIGVYLLTVVAFALWIYRVSKNCHGFAGGMEISPGMAVGWFFIPFANLVMPCKAMLEVWKVSTNPAEWNSEKDSILVAIWWAFWILTGVFGQIIWYLPKAHDRESLALTTGFLIGLEILKLTVGSLAVAVVYSITRKQKVLVGRASSPA